MAKNMRNIKLVIQFDGTSYHGWQTQGRDKTVQETVRDALSRILNSPVTLHGSGRTDAGVHALEQVGHFKTLSGLDLKSLKKGVNSILPRDIVVTHMEEVDPEFHSRFSARGRVYQYFIWNAAERSPFYERYAWHIVQPLDVGAMKKAMQALIGTHDFSSFQGGDKEAVNPVREVRAVRVKKAGKPLIVFEIEAGSFIKHMVRNIVGTLVEVGKGKLAAGEVKEILEKKDRRYAKVTAPACGLFLKKVKY